MKRRLHALLPGLLPALLLALVPAALGCASGRIGRVTLESASGQIDRAEQELASGAPVLAFERLQKAWEVRSLPPEERARAQSLLERAAELVVATDPGGEALVDLAELQLPKRLRIELWIAGARRLLEEGERMDAYRAVRDLEEEFPLHLERDAAAGVVAEAGFSLADDDRSYFFFFDYRDKAPEVLEYLVITFPSSEHCDRAYWILADLYEQDRQWRLASERHEDLLLYHPTSPFAVYSEAKIPYLRLARVARSSYDRSEFVRARAELERWLTRHPGHELEPDVLALLEEARARLVDNDLVVAAFYERVENAFGGRYHAERALAEARLLEDVERVAAAEALLASLPAADKEIDPSRSVGPRLDQPVDEGFGIPVEEPGLERPGVER